EEADSLLWHSGFRIAKIPAGVSGERDIQLGETNAAKVITVGVDARDENREWFSDPRRLLGDDAVRPKRSEVEPKGLMNAFRNGDTRDRGKFQVLPPNECFAGQRRIATLGRKFSVPDPIVHRDEE